MVYIRKIIVKGNIYYELVKCERDSNGEPRQKHLAYLKKSLIPQEDIIEFEKEFKVYDPITKRIVMILHSIMKGNEGLLNLEELYKKTKNQGILKSVVDNFILEHLNTKKYARLELNKSEIKTNLPDDIIREIENTAITKNYLKNILEKVVRLNLILQEISENKFLSEKLIFFGGTAINSIYNNYPRLSEDIDLQYINPHDKELMELERTKIKKEIRKILTSNKYHFKETDYKMNQFKIIYETNTGSKEYIKLEINYVDSTSILPTTKETVKYPISNKKYKITTLQKEELYAKKMSALLDRSASRDLYDIYKLDNYNKDIFRKCLIATYLLREGDIKKITNPQIAKLTNNDFNKHLKPMIKQNESITVKDMYDKANNIMKEINKSLTQHEIDFAKNFDKDNPQFEKLFEDIKINPKIDKSSLLELSRDFGV